MKGRRVRKGVRVDVGEGGQGRGEGVKRDEGSWRWLYESEVETEGRWSEQNTGTEGGGVWKERTRHTGKEGGDNPKGWRVKKDRDGGCVKGRGKAMEGREGSEIEAGDEDEVGESGKEGRRERRSWEGVQCRRGAWFDQ